MINYWLVRALWDGVDDKTREFINDDNWINGYSDKYLNIVKRINENDVLVLANKSNITHYAICIENEQDGRHIQVNEWKKFNKPKKIYVSGAYIKTIAKINDSTILEITKNAIEELNNTESIQVKSLKLENFTLFKKEKINFSNGLNILIGENSTGKSQILKILYTFIKSNNIVSQNKMQSMFPMDHTFEKTITNTLINIFKPSSNIDFVSQNSENCYFEINFNKYNLKCEINKHGTLRYFDLELPSKFFYKKVTFIPAKEILSFIDGFTAIYPNTSFDETFYDLAISLEKLIPKNIQLDKLEDSILKQIEKLLDGEIIQQNGKFYLTKGNITTPITLIAEGFRKIGTIAHLLANGSLDKNSILLWDEPEANLNPKNIQYIAQILLELSRGGMQIFIATHSLFLIKEIEILRKEHEKINYISLGFDNNNLRVSQNKIFENLDDIAILDEEFNQSDRFMKVQ